MPASNPSEYTLSLVAPPSESITMGSMFENLGEHVLVGRRSIIEERIAGATGEHAGSSTGWRMSDLWREPQRDRTVAVYRSLMKEVGDDEALLNALFEADLDANRALDLAEIVPFIKGWLARKRFMEKKV